MGATTMENKAALMSDPDPEMRYYQASILAFCGQKDLALTLLRSAIEHNYCATSALQVDPLWANLRDDPTFEELQGLANQCQTKFMVALTASDH
jgi:hypothetical protein